MRGKKPHSDDDGFSSTIQQLSNPYGQIVVHRADGITSEWPIARELSGRLQIKILSGQAHRRQPHRS